jgi:hypothetical protein
MAPVRPGGLSVERILQRCGSRLDITAILLVADLLECIRGDQAAVPSQHLALDRCATTGCEHGQTLQQPDRDRDVSRPSWRIGLKAASAKSSKVRE